MTSEQQDKTLDTAEELTESMNEKSVGSSSETSHDYSSENKDGVENLFSIDYKWFTTAFYGGILVWVAWLLFQTRGWAFEDWVFPRMVGIPTILLLLAQIVKVQFPRFVDSLKPQPSESEDTFGVETDESTRPKHEQEKYELIMMMWVVLLPLAVYYLGFLVALPLYLLSFLLYFLSNAVRAIAITVATSVAIYLLFVELLGVRFAAGAWELPLVLF